jgi:uncharacterized protein involved in outer membrane biogenesis
VAKKVLIGLAVLLLLAGGGVYLAYHSLDIIVKMAVEHYAPDVTGVAFKVGEVRISVRDGRGTLRNIDIGNPPGFGAPRAARLGEIRVALDPLTLTDPVIFMHELSVVAPVITYERGDKATNLDVIQKNIEAYIKRSDGSVDGKVGESRPAEAKQGRRKFIIERLVIRGAKVTMTNPALRGQGLSFDLPDIDLRDVGKRQGGATASEIGNMVAGVIQQRIAQKVITNVDLLRRGGVEGAVDALKGLLK